MLQFLLTGVNKEGLVQNDPSKSLGGYVSSTPVPNGGLNALFPSVSLTDMLEGERIVRAIVIKNTSNDVIAAGSALHYERDVDAYCNWRMAVVELGQDDCGYYMEKITNQNSLPSVGTFIDNDCLLHQIQLPEIPAGGMLGIWIERTINVNKAKDVLTSCDALNTQFEQEETQQVMRVTTGPDIGNSLDLSWFLLRTVTGKFQLYYDNSESSLPAELQSGFEPIRIKHNTGMSDVTSASNLEKAINDVLVPRGEIASAVYENNTVTITVKQSGPVNDLEDGTGGAATGFLFETLTQGITAKENDKQEGARILVDTP